MKTFACRRKKIRLGALAILTLIAVGSRPGLAAPRDFGIGVTLGSPTGLSLLQNLDSTSAVQAALEWNVYNPFVAQGDYLFKEGGPFRQVAMQYGKPWIYYGLGLRYEWGGRDQSLFGPYRHTDNGRLAIRFPAGVQYYLPKAPFDCFFEAVPMVSLWPSTTLDLTVALGLRFNL